MEKKAIDSRVVIIDKDGTTHYLGSVKEIEFHGEYLMDYINEYYHGDTEFDGLDIGSPRDQFGYHLGKVGKATYFNGESYGVIYLPKDVSDAQIDSVYALDLGDQPVMVGFNPEDYGFICYETIGMNGDYTLKEAMDEYTEKMKEMNSHLKR